MIKAHEFQQGRHALQETIRDAIRAIVAQTTIPSVVGNLTRCLDLVAPQQADDGEALLPDPVHKGRNCPNEARHAIVTHDVKKAIIRFWELCQRGETAGLRDYLNRLEDHATHDWKVAGELLGTEHTGYQIFYGPRTLPDPRDGIVEGELQNFTDKIEVGAFEKAEDFEPVPDDPETENPETGADPQSEPPPFRREVDA